MKFLLDTHIFLWSLLEPERLSRPVMEGLEDPANQLWLSPISVWETLMLAERGRVVLKPEPGQWVRDALKIAPVREAPLNHEVALVSRTLDLPHKDPADRFIAATAKVFELTLITADKTLLGCPDISLLANQG